MELVDLIHTSSIISYVVSDYILFYTDMSRFSSPCVASIDRPHCAHIAKTVARQRNQRI